ncbi:MAG: tetratricopeptide repeat protein [Gammaproteobacteria bacterium]|nr:tetratricopeptide repeat protein [Gammaproteobacteria bacterium]
MKHLLILSLVILGGCMSAPTPRQPTGPGHSAPPSPPVVERPLPAPAPQPGAGPKAPAVVAPEPARSASSDATDSLVRLSEEAAKRGDHRSAIGALERALRIDGRNADLWARLSVACLREGRVNLARQYANRATTLAGPRVDWKRSAALAVAAIEEHVGNYDEAERIRALYRRE